VAGVGRLHSQGNYGFAPNDEVLVPNCPPLRPDGALRHTYSFNAAQTQQLFAAIAPLWCNPDGSGYIDRYTMPEKMTVKYFLSEEAEQREQPDEEGGSAAYG